MNLSNAKKLLFWITAALLVIGYTASQWFYFEGRAAQYAKIVDVPSIQSLALLLLVAFIVLALVPEKPEVAQ